jgi:iron complex outermembrane receptor protein
MRSTEQLLEQITIFFGGTDNIVYRASVGYANLNGILKRDNMERSTLGVSVTGNFLDNHLKLNLITILL